MPATLTKSGSCKVTLSVIVSAEDVKSKIDSNYQELQKTANIKGFRPGKCPIQRLRRLYGEQVVETVKGDLLTDSLSEAIQEHKLDTIGQPRIENSKFAEDEDFNYQAVCFVKPEFEVTEYLGVKADVTRDKVTDETVNEIFDQLRKSRSKPAKKSDSSKVKADSDLVMADVTINLGDTELFHDEGFGPIHQDMKGIRGIPMDGLWAALAGTKTGDTVDLKATIPEAFASKPEARGQEVEVILAVTEVHEMALPSVEDLLKEMDFDTEDELRDEIRKGQESRLENEFHSRAEDAIVTQVVEANKFDLPDDLIQEQADQAVERKRLELQKEEKNEKDIETELKSLRTESRESLTKSFKTFFTLDKIAKKEKIFVTENDVTQALSNIAANYGQPVDAVREHMESSGRLSELRDQLKETKVRSFLREKAEITEIEGKKETEEPTAAKKKKTAQKTTAAKKKKTTKAKTDK